MNHPLFQAILQQWEWLTAIGPLDLYRVAQLPLVNPKGRSGVWSLDTLYASLQDELDSLQQGRGLSGKRSTKASSVVEGKMAIVKEFYDYRQAEADKKTERAAALARLARLQGQQENASVEAEKAMTQAERAAEIQRLQESLAE